MYHCFEMELNSFAHARGDLNCVPKVIRDCFGFTLFCSGIGPLSQPITGKTKTNHDLVACVFPRFGLFGCFCCCFFYFEFTFGLNVFAFLCYCFDLFLRHSNRKALYQHPVNQSQVNPKSLSSDLRTVCFYESVKQNFGVRTSYPFSAQIL